MKLDPYWDKPELTPEALIKLQTEKNVLKLQIQKDKDFAEQLWEMEQKLRDQLRELTLQRDYAQAAIKESRASYEKISTIEIDFAEQVRKEQELAALENRMSDLENRLRAISEGQTFWTALMPYQKEDLLYK